MNATSTDRGARPATVNQRAYIKGLLAQHGAPASLVARGTSPDLTHDECTDLIWTLKALPARWDPEETPPARVKPVAEEQEGLW